MRCGNPPCVANGCQRPGYCGIGGAAAPRPILKGCVCPPTAEQTCMRRDCGRKDLKFAGGVKLKPAAVTPNPDNHEQVSDDANGPRP